MKNNKKAKKLLTPLKDLGLVELTTIFYTLQVTAKVAPLGVACLREKIGVCILPLVALEIV